MRSTFLSKLQRFSPKIIEDDLEGPEIAKLLRDHSQNMFDASPPDSIHTLSIDLLKLKNMERRKFIKSSVAGGAFGGGVFHSCGNWSKFVDIVKEIPGLVAVDGAFSE